jgi:hypothetical protein
MQEYRIGRQRTKARRQKSVMVNIAFPRPIFDRLAALAAALQADVGPSHTVTVPSIIRRLLYAHPSLKQLAQRHYSQPKDGGNGLVT